ncbi:hypothetical protein Acr_02g0002130 [Actinidia rufa]|uniref:Uncharacterized protein n=1 Tax=Actinidia rufa TaxID=165716 RepID=A0A7J0E641_9ERIC|nr:hypothetical protein Acr_02g0002130 [Actinidia rufa]
MSLAMKRSEIIDQGQGISCQMFDIHPLSPHDVLQIATYGVTGKSIGAGVLVRQGCADPSLYVVRHEIGRKQQASFTDKRLIAATACLDFSRISRIPDGRSIHIAYFLAKEVL